MRRTLSLVLSLLMILSAFTFQTAFAADDIKVTINGQNLTMDQPPVLVSDRTLVPVRAIFEALGAKVDWNNDTNTATGVLGDTTVEIQIENTVAKVNGKDVTLDVPAKLISDRTLVPVRFISESLGAKVDWDNDTQTVIITTSAENSNVIYSQDFESVEGENGKTLNKEIGTVAASGNAVMIDKTTAKSGTTSVKVNASNNATLNIGSKFFIPENCQSEFVEGDTYTLSAYIYLVSPGGNYTRFVIKALNGTGTKTGVMGESTEVKSGEWTKISNTFKYAKADFSEGSVNIRIENVEKNVDAGSYYFVDDITVTRGEVKSDDTKNEDAKFAVSEVVNGHRPVPTGFTTGKDYDDIVYYGYGSGKTNDELIKNLPEGTVIVDENTMFSSAEKPIGTEYGTFEVVDVQDQPFKKAVRATVTTLPEKPYSFQLDLGSVEGKGTQGDICLLKVYMRTLSGGNYDTHSGQVQFIVEENVAPNRKLLQSNFMNGPTWSVAYFPFEFKDGYTRLTARFGYYLQCVEVGGYEIVNYGKNVTLDDMPTNAGNIPTLNKDAAWRKEAWDRIEKIRKGDIKVIVKDAQGNAVSNAKVDVNMYEHEFEFGTAVNTNIIKGTEDKSVIQKNFNSAVLESHTKWVVYDQNPELAKTLFKTLKDIGIKNLRGHTLVWDRGYERTYDKETDKWKDNTAVPEELVRLTLAGDKNAIQACIKKHIDKITSDLSEFNIKDWDVLNEATTNTLLQDMFGREIINEWYDMAREALGKDGILYYNDYKIKEEIPELYDLLDTMVKNNVDFDGIGLQSHFDSLVDIEQIIDFYNQLDQRYGKRLKITEYDYTTDDPILQANYTRDILIASFAQESVDGFIMWGYKGGPGSKYVMYDDNWNEKPGLNAWQDLIYNKWWTNESGTTSADGSFATRGYYGDYDITVTAADGKTKTVSVPCYKGNDNTITISLD